MKLQSSEFVVRLSVQDQSIAASYGEGPSHKLINNKQKAYAVQVMREVMRCLG